MERVVPGPGDVLEAALAARRADLCVLPAANDGSKKPYPDRAEWAKWQRERPSESIIRQWFVPSSVRYSGFGLVCGAISGGLELLEFEGQAVAGGLLQEFQARAKQVGLFDVLRRITEGYCESTPGGGIHLLYRCPQPGSTKLACTEGHDTLIETKGEGGYVIVAPSNGRTHPTGGSWVLRKGGFDSIATINAEERDALLDLARSFDRRPRQEWQPPASVGKAGGGRPGDDFNDRPELIPTILEEAGWQYLFTTRDGNQHWRRPGKRLGNSATWHPGMRLLYVFSSSTAFPESYKAYRPFGVAAFVKFDGDFARAARWLRGEGYGDRVEEAIDDLYSLPSAPPDEWPTLDPIALHGPVGAFVKAAVPYTEADPAGILVATLVMCGAAIGRGPYFQLGNAHHRCNLFAVLMGATSMGRKGTAEDVANGVMVASDQLPPLKGGFGSGEKIIDDLVPQEGNSTTPGS